MTGITLLVAFALLAMLMGWLQNEATSDETLYWASDRRRQSVHRGAWATAATITAVVAALLFATSG